MAIIKWIKTWGKSVVAIGALVIAVSALALSVYVYLEVTKPHTIHEEIYNKLERLDKRIQRVEEDIAAVRATGGDVSSQSLNRLNQTKEIRYQADLAWVKMEYSKADKFILQAYEVLPKDVIPPVVIGVTGSKNITETSAEIFWTTDEPSGSKVEFWTRANEYTAIIETLDTEHLIRLTNLQPATTYHYKIMSRDEAGNIIVSRPYTFTTPGKPAIFIASDWVVSQTVFYTGREVTISFWVTNTGDLAGSYEVALKVNGVVEATREVTLDAGTGEEVTFTTFKNIAGTYLISIDGLTGSFVVAPPPPAKGINWWPIVGIIAGVVLLLILIILLTTRTKEKAEKGPEKEPGEKVAEKAKALVSAAVRWIYYRQPLKPKEAKKGPKKEPREKATRRREGHHE